MLLDRRWASYITGAVEFCMPVVTTYELVCAVICPVGAAGGYSPSEVRVFTNRDDLDFGMANDLPPVQRWDLAENLRGDIELPCNVRAAIDV